MAAPDTDPDTLVSLFAARTDGAHARRDRPALRTKRAGRWETLTWGDWRRRSRAIAAELIAAGVARGDRVAIFASTREEWVIVDVAIMLAGAVTVPLYPTLTGEQAAYILRDSGARVLFAEEPSYVARLKEGEGRAAAASLARIVYFGGAPANFAEGESHLGELLAEGQRRLDRDESELDARIAACAAGDLASIVYTSGTTGEPKGAMLTHASFAFATEALATTMQLGASDEHLLFLPLAHIFARIMVAVQLRVGFVTSFAESIVKVMDNATEVNPTFMGCVPRLYEKVFLVTHEKVAEEGAIKQGVFDWAVGIGREVARARERGLPVDGFLKVQHHYADRLILSKVRARFGKRLRFAISGGAPLSRELAEWFHGCGVRVLEGYGLTETTAAVTLSTPSAYRFGAVGRPLPGVEVTLGDDGEVMVRGPNVMKGFFGKPDATREMIDADGFLHTGDIGIRDASGFVTITDRKKDILVTASGKNIAPQSLENRLKQSPWVSQAVVYGDRRPYLVALITLNSDAMARFARETGRIFDLEALAGDSEVRARIELEVAAVNRRVAPHESIKAFAILPRDLSVDAGEVTPTLKIKRKVVTEKHQALLESLYERGSQRPPSS